MTKDDFGKTFGRSASSSIGQLMMTQSVQTSCQNRLLSSTKHPRMSYSVSIITMRVISKRSFESLTTILAVRVSNGSFGRALFLDRGRATGVLDQLHNGILHSLDWFLSLGIRHLVEQFSEGQNSQIVLTGGCQGDDTISFSVSEESARTASRAAFAIALIYVQVARAHPPKPYLAPKTTSLCVQASFGLHSKVSIYVCQHQKNL